MSTVAAQPVSTTSSTATVPAPHRTVSTEIVNVCQPIPEISALQASVDRLERSAEELSQGGSDIGEEIRKLHLEQEASSANNSRRSSIVNDPFSDQSHHLPGVATRSRGASTSSYTNSIIDLNNQARWGGYSPAAFVGSPSLSMKSGSRSRAGTVQRVPSNGAAMRPEPVQEGRPLDSPVVTPSTFIRKASQASTISASMLASLEDDDATGAPPPVPMDTTVPEPSPRPSDLLPSSSIIHDDAESFPDLDLKLRNPEEARPDSEYEQHPDPSQRPSSADTSHQANTLFLDFDGVHFSPTHEEFVAVDDAGNELSRVPLEEVIHEEEQQVRFREQAEQLRQLRAEQQRTDSAIYEQQQVQQRRDVAAYPMPAPNMTYYPAPVPRMLNLPKKLTQPLPPRQPPVRQSRPVTQAPTPRKSFLPTLEFQPDSPSPRNSPARQSFAHSRSGSVSPERPPQDPQELVEQRRSMMSLRMLPPQLRASVFFDQQPSVQQDVDIQKESAVATLDSILAASATAPVNVFVDHPLAGRNPQNYYKTERKKKPAAVAGDPNAPRRKPMLSMHERAAQIDDARRPFSALPGMQSEIMPSKTGRRNSIASMLTDLGGQSTKKLNKRSSRMSLSAIDDLKAAQEIEPAPDSPAFVDAKEDQTESAPPTARLFDEDGQPIDMYDDEYDEESENDEPQFAQPTTLLAELQMRKVQQKSRNRTAATAFPNGMHSTLLELDAVAQIEKQKRKKHKVALAWEEPEIRHESEDEDADIPLAVLFNSKKGLPASMTKPNTTRAMGLMERRQMEDNEPLSSRRNRILGIDTRPRNSIMPQPEPSPAEDDDIPLAERRRRVKQREALNSALGDISGNRESTFSADLMSQFGGEQKSATSGRSATTVEGAIGAENVAPEVLPENETLGQRRARLQRERIAAGDLPKLPVLRSSSSLANLLATNPVGEQEDPTRKRVSLNAGGLLSQAEQEIAQNKDKLRQRLIRGNSSSHLLAGVDPRPQSAGQSPGQSPSRPSYARQRTSSTTFDKLPGTFAAPTEDQTRQSMLMQQQQSDKEQARQSVAMQILQQQQLQQAMLQQQQPQQYGVAQAQGQFINPLAHQSFMAPAPPLNQYGQQLQQQPNMNLYAYQQANTLTSPYNQMGMTRGMIANAGQVSNMAGVMAMPGMTGEHFKGLSRMFASPTTQTQHSMQLAKMMRDAGAAMSQQHQGQQGMQTMQKSPTASGFNVPIPMNGQPGGGLDMMNIGMMGVDPAQRAAINRWRSSVAQ